MNYFQIVVNEQISLRMNHLVYQVILGITTLYEYHNSNIGGSLERIAKAIYTLLEASGDVSLSINT